MLDLTRIKLVNWHFFENTVIEIGPTTLFAGDNGSGKSTIIDAVQYALVAHINKIRFNAAAAESRTSRNLQGYCRCKIGTDTLDYLRGDCITHVVLEFGKGEQRFCAGVMVEAFADMETREHQWILESGTLEDIAIFEDDHFLPARVFRDGIKEQGGLLCSTKREYNSRLTHLLGVHRRNSSFNPYLEALVRSVNFTPVTSINDFVCSYILEERQVDISAMKENLANYKEAEREAAEMERKIEALEKIESVELECEKLEKQVLFQEYFRRRIDLEAVESRQAEVRRRREKVENNLNLLRENLAEAGERKERLETVKQELVFALAENDQHRLYERLNRQASEARTRLAAEREKQERLEELTKRCETLLGRGLSGDLAADIEETDREYRENTEEQVRTVTELKAAGEEMRGLKEEYRDVERGILRYPESTETLKKALEKEGISAAVFADQLEVTELSWQNAVEGWLNTQRFNILVPEDDFQKAIEVYRGLPKKTGGVGVPNLARMHGREIIAGSLAELVEAATPVARRYAAFLLGDVIRADIKTLKTYERSITKECMSYSGHTAKRIKEEVYSRWYIGREAKKRRLETLEKEIEEIERRIESLTRERRMRREREDVLKEAYRLLHDCRELTGAGERIARIEEELAELEERIAGIDTGAFEQIKLQIESVTTGMHRLDEEINKLHNQIGSEDSNLLHCRTELEGLTGEHRRFSSVLEGFLAEHPEYKEEFEAYYGERIKNERKQAGPGGTAHTDRLDYEGLKSRYESAIRGFKTRLEKARTELMELKNNFNHTYLTYLPTTYGALDFGETLVKYRETELPEYKDKIRRAREEAEHQFREHFVSRLNEYISDAKESFAEINYTLGPIRFGQDQYRFSIEERQDKRNLLEVIRSAAEINEFEGTLFEALDSEEQKENIERLFSSILNNELDSEEVRDLCDYRQYFQYDIKIKHLDTLDRETSKPLESSLARVLREKSGGETQTPYYVAIAASFFRFYKDETDSTVRLVLFDEAFNKMDDERIGKMIDFFRRLDMQVITAVPTEKIESIAPYMDVTNLVLRRDYNAYVRRYTVLPEEETEDEQVAWPRR
jgi:uncharacterized protein YPO0396